jgi:hypothetical protein
MTTYNGTNYAKYVAPAPLTLMGGEFGGKRRGTWDTYTFAGEAAGTIVNVGVLKPGETFAGGQITAAALGSSVTIALGISGQAACFLAATTMNTAGLVTFCAAQGTYGVGYKNTGVVDIPIFITTAGAAATGRIDVVIDVLVQN